MHVCCIYITKAIGNLVQTKKIWHLWKNTFYFYYFPIEIEPYENAKIKYLDKRVQIHVGGEKVRCFWRPKSL